MTQNQKRYRYAVLDGILMLTVKDTRDEALAYAHSYEREQYRNNGVLTLLDIRQFVRGSHDQQG